MLPHLRQGRFVTQLKTIRGGGGLEFGGGVCKYESIHGAQNSGNVYI